MLILIDDLDQSVTAKAATHWERLVSRVRAAKLDRDIATGASPDADAFLALRAQALVQPAMRRQLADGLARMMEEAGADRAPPFLDPRISIQRDSILDASDALQMLIDRLLEAAPVPARGVAKARLLLTDGVGPLYYPSRHGDLRAHVLAAVDQLEPLSNW